MATGQELHLSKEGENEDSTEYIYSISTYRFLPLYENEEKRATGPYSEYGVCFILFTVHLL